MERRLIYYFYVKDNIDVNLSYYINKICLKQYINNFDKFLFWVVLDDLSNSVLKTKAINWILDIVKDKEVEIKFKHNTEYYEALMFKKEIVDKLDDFENELIFFAHNKASSKFDFLDNQIVITDNLSSIFSLTAWIYALYFFSFVDMDEMEYKLKGRLFTETFYGPLLSCGETITNRYKIAYLGTFFWLNPMDLNRRIDISHYEKKEIENRFYAEQFPGTICSRENWGMGLTSHKNMALADCFLFYNMDPETWQYVFSVFGEDDAFNNIKALLKNATVELYKNNNLIV